MQNVPFVAPPFQHTTRYTQLNAAPFKDFWR
jgi:hypothetical protein